MNDEQTDPGTLRASGTRTCVHRRRGGIDWRTVFAFPNPVNEYAARVTAALVVLLSVVTLLTGFGWGLAAIAAGFWLRVLFGPRISPLAQLSVKVLTPRLGKTRLVPGPPKRFAQGIGAADVHRRRRPAGRRDWRRPRGSCSRS